jgi:phosphoribosylamine--glycine ligase
LRNLGVLIQATLEGNLDAVEPEVRTEQLAMCSALVTGAGGPDGQKGYPWSCTRGEPVVIDYKYMRRKGIQVIPSAMMGSADEAGFRSDGTRVAFLNANMTVKAAESRGQAAERCRNKLLAAFDNGKIRVIPREDANGNRLDLRRDIGSHYLAAEAIFPNLS